MECKLGCHERGKIASEHQTEAETKSNIQIENSMLISWGSYITTKLRTDY